MTLQYMNPQQQAQQAQQQQMMQARGQQRQQGQQQIAGRANPYSPPSPGGGMGSPSGGGGLPQTGLQQQLSSLSSLRQAGQQLGTGQATAAQNLPIEQPGGYGGTSLNQLAQNLAQSYGLAVPRGPIVDAQGNFTVMPDQLAAASGGAETSGSAAAKMNYISAAITKRQNMQQMAKARATAETGLGLVQSRGRGSLAALQSGLYQNLANLYASEQYEAADFSYFIQKEYLDVQSDILRRQEKLAKKKARFGFISGIGMTLAGAFTGNPALIAGGVQGISQGGDTGWF